MAKSKSQQFCDVSKCRVTGFDNQCDLGAADTVSPHLPLTYAFLANVKTLARIQANVDSALADLITDATDMLVSRCCHRIETTS